MVASFSEWVNEQLLSNETLKPNFLRKISAETAKQWMHKLGFEVTPQRKGKFVDGHECVDVVEYYKKFLRQIVSLGF